MLKRTLGRVILLLFVTLITVVQEGVAMAAVTTPLDQIKITVNGIIAVMQDKELSKPDKKDARRDKIMAYVNQRFDLEEMSKLTLANKWRELTSEQQKTFEGLFSDLLKNTYIGRVEAYSDEVVQYEKEVFNGDQRTRAMVYTNVVKNNREIPINYKLLNRNGEWFVYDVLIEGVSLVSNYRTEFSRILNQEQYPGLIKRLQEKTASREGTKN